MGNHRIYTRTFDDISMNTSIIHINRIKLTPVHIFGAFLMFFMLFFPVSYNMIRALTLGVVLIFVCIDVLLLNIKINRVALAWILVFVGSNMFFIFWGVLNSAPGAIRVATVDLLWPIVFFVMGLGLRNIRDFILLSKWILIVANLISLYDISYILINLGYVNLPTFLYTLDLGMGFGNYSSLGFIEYTTTHMASFMFLVPFTMSLLFLTKKGENFINKKFIVFTLILELFCVIASGKSALVLVSIISPLIFLTVNLLAKTSRKSIPNPFNLIKFLLIVVIGFIIAIYISNKMGWSISVILENLLIKLNIFNSDTNLSTSLREQQFWALFNGWLESPLIGHGAGSYTSEIIRSYEYVWAYELSYSALLFQKGIIGFGVFWAFVIWICSTIIRKVRLGVIRSSLALPYIVGLLGFLVANGTNPYLSKFSYMWILFIPFALAQINTKENKEMSR